jgi:ankyrin repeat protein
MGDQAAVRQFHRDGKLINEIHTLRGGLLSIAVRTNQPEMVSLLLDLGLDVDETVTGEEGTWQSWGMPLWFCAMGGRPEIADLLLSRGADPNSIVYACGGPLGIAEDVGDDETAAVIKKYGVRLVVESVASGRDVETARAILDGKLQAFSLNVADPTPTDLAEQMLWAAAGNEEIVRVCLPHMTRRRDDPWWNYVLLHATDPAGFRLILESGVDPDVISDGGYTILQHLASDYCGDPDRTIRARLLLNAGASLSTRDPILKSTPLGWACRWGRLDLVRLYLSHGADPREPGAEPWATPHAWAAKGEHFEVLQLLQAESRESRTNQN